MERLRRRCRSISAMALCLSYLELTQPENRPNLARGMQEFCAYYSNRLSYREVAELVERHCGAGVLSSQAIWQLGQQQAGCN